MRCASNFKATTLLSAALVGFDLNYLAQGGPPASIWLSGEASRHPAVEGRRIPGRGAEGRRGAWPDQVLLSPTAEDLGTDVSTPQRLTWGCGGPLEWREANTGSARLTADTLVICGAHQLGGREVRLNVRARHLVLRDASIETTSDGFFDLRSDRLTLEGRSRVESRAPNSKHPPFVSSANISVSAQAIDGEGHLDVETRGADFRAE